VYEVGVFPSMKKGDIVGHIVIHVFSLMSIVIVSRATRLILGRKIIDRRTSP
jgi:hypothetical protein